MGDHQEETSSNRTEIMTSHALHLIILAVLNIPVYVVVIRIVFGSFAGFFECIRNGFNASYNGDFIGIPPNIWSHVKVMSCTIAMAVLLIYEDDLFFHGN